VLRDIKASSKRGVENRVAMNSRQQKTHHYKITRRHAADEECKMP